MIGRLVGNYQVYEKLGQGGMGTVYRAVDVMLDREVAIKVLRPELASQPEILERFRSEAITLAKLHHQNIATLYSLAREEGELMMVMEFVRGETMERMLARLGRIAPGTAVAWCCQILDAMQYAHRKGVVHRDIKPANVMITDEGVVKVTDFGIARVLGEHRMTRTGHIIGTVAYMAPEQIRGRDVDARTDLYALGTVLFELLTGRTPFLAEDEFALMMAQVNQAPPLARACVPELPDWLDSTLQRALAKDPTARYQSATHFHAALREGEREAPLETDPRVAYAEPTVIEVPPSGPQPSAPPPSAVPVPPTRVAAPAPPPTRLASPATPAPAAPQTPVSPTAIGVVQPRPTIWQQLNWRHYAAAAGLAVIVLALAAVWLAGRSREAAGSPGSQAAPRAALASPARQEPSPSAPQPGSAAAPVAVDSTSVPPASRPSERVVERTPTPPPSPQPARPKKTPERLQLRQAEPPAPDAAAEKPLVPVARAEERPAGAALATYGSVNWVLAQGEGTEETEVVLEFRKDAVRIRPTSEEVGGRTVEYGAISSLAYSERKPSRWKRLVPFFKSNHWLTVGVGGDSIVLHLDNDNYKTVVAEFESRSGVKARR